MQLSMDFCRTCSGMLLEWGVLQPGRHEFPATGCAPAWTLPLDALENENKPGVGMHLNTNVLTFST